MNDVIKVVGWTLGGAIVVVLLTNAQTGSSISAILSAWSNVIGAVTGRGNQQPQATAQAPSIGAPQGMLFG